MIGDMFKSYLGSCFSMFQLSWHQRKNFSIRLSGLVTMFDERINRIVGDGYQKLVFQKLTVEVGIGCISRFHDQNMLFVVNIGVLHDNQSSGALSDLGCVLDVTELGYLG